MKKYLIIFMLYPLGIIGLYLQLKLFFVVSVFWSGVYAAIFISKSNKKIGHTIFFTVILFALNLLSGMLIGAKSILIFSGIWTSIGLCIAVANLVLLIILSGLQKRVIKDIER